MLLVVLGHTITGCTIGSHQTFLFNVIWLLIDFLRDINGKTIRKWWIILLVDLLIIAGISFMYFAYKGQWIKPNSINTLAHIENSISNSENTQVPKKSK